jgi:hypothetical protein
MKSSITIKFAESDNELEQILSLQEINLSSNVLQENKKTNGFVTVKHDLSVLEKMNTAAPQIIAKNGDEVIAYALVMPKEFSSFIPVLIPMFEMFEKLPYKGKVLTSYSYYVMGQICIAKPYRGIGVFEKLYAQHKETYSKKFELCLTEVSSSNPRSMRAHEKVGFKTIHNFDDKTDNWNILVWDWR